MTGPTPHDIHVLDQAEATICTTVVDPLTDVARKAIDGGDRTVCLLTIAQTFGQYEPMYIATAFATAVMKLAERAP
jgi:hypothetical protein